MRSARTDRPETRIKTGTFWRRSVPGTRRTSSGRTAPRGTRRLVAYLSGTVLLLLAVSACASGSADEARQGQARDERQTPELPEHQATLIAEEFFPITPTPTPSPVPAPALGALVLTVNVGAGDAPQQSYASVPTDAGRVFTSALLTGVSAGQVVAVTWTDQQGNPVDTVRVELTANAAQQWVSLPIRLDGSLPPGEYAAYLFVDDQRLSSLALQLTGPGSGPQPLPELPPNPQADREQPNDSRNNQQPNQNGQEQGENQIIPVTTTP